MAEDLRVVARFIDGTVLKGTLLDFSTKSPTFKLQPKNGGNPVDVGFTELKAVFFVKDLNGKAQRRNLQGFLRSPSATPQGIKIAVRFTDGEILCGHSNTYTKGCEGYFMFPADTGSNNLRVYVLLSSTAEVAVGPAAEALVRAALRRRTA